MRLFIAIDPSAKQRRQLQSLQQHLAGLIDGVKWTRPEALHLTLKFLGELDREALVAVTAAMEEAAPSVTPFAMRFGGAGVFPSPQRTRIIWAGITAGAAELKALAAVIEQALTRRGFPSEVRPFKAHLTLGRVRRPLKEELVYRLLEQQHSFATESAAVQACRLYESRPSRQGAQYTVLREILFLGK